MLAPLVHRLARPFAGWLLALVPAAIFLFLVTLPFSLLHNLSATWPSYELLGVAFTFRLVLVPLFIMLLAYPLLSLDRIGILGEEVPLVPGTNVGGSYRLLAAALTEHNAQTCEPINGQAPVPELILL